MRKAVDELSEEEDHAGATNNDWPTDHCRRDKAPLSDTDRNPGDGTSLSRTYIISGAVERHGAKFPNGRTEDYETFLREYIENSSFPDKYLIAEFLLQIQPVSLSRASKPNTSVMENRHKETKLRTSDFTTNEHSSLRST